MRFALDFLLHYSITDSQIVQNYFCLRFRAPILRIVLRSVTQVVAVQDIIVKTTTELITPMV